MSSLQIGPDEQDLKLIGISKISKQKFIINNTSILKVRQKELRALQKRKHIDEATEKRIKRLKEIVVNLQQSLKRTKKALCLNRFYGI